MVGYLNRSDSAVPLFRFLDRVTVFYPSEPSETEYTQFAACVFPDDNSDVVIADYHVSSGHGDPDPFCTKNDRIQTEQYHDSLCHQA